MTNLVQTGDRTSIIGLPSRSSTRLRVFHFSFCATANEARFPLSPQRVPFTPPTQNTGPVIDLITCKKALYAVNDQTCSLLQGRHKENQFCRVEFLFGVLLWLRSWLDLVCNILGDIIIRLRIKLEILQTPTENQKVFGAFFRFHSHIPL